MKVWISALLIVLGFTVWGDEFQTLWATAALCMVKILMIFCGGCLAISEDNNGR